MKRLRSPRFAACFSVVLWAAGNVAIWFLTPYGPRDGWQPPEDEFVSGFLSDSRTLVTIPRSPDGQRSDRNPETGPVRLWDIETGKLKASHFGRSDAFVFVRADCLHDWLLISERSKQESGLFHLRIHDAWTGRLIAKFQCRHPNKHYNGWFQVTADGKRTAFLTHDGELPYIKCYAIPNQKLLCTLPAREPWCFSPDGARVAAMIGKEITVFELPNCREMARLSAPATASHPLAPYRFSHNGDLLLDNQRTVWDLKTGTPRFRAAQSGFNSSLFTEDGQELIVTATSKTNAWLAYYDVTTGAEKIVKRIPLAQGSQPGWMYVAEATPDTRLPLASGTPDVRQPTKFEIWLSRFSIFETLGRDHGVDQWFVIDTTSAKEIARGLGGVWSATPDGRYLLQNYRDNMYKLWDIPARKPLRWLLPAFAIWTAALTSLACWLAARADRRSRSAPAAAIATPSKVL